MRQVLLSELSQGQGDRWPQAERSRACRRRCEDGPRRNARRYALTVPAGSRGWMRILGEKIAKGKAQAIERWGRGLGSNAKAPRQPNRKAMRG